MISETFLFIHPFKHFHKFRKIIKLVLGVMRTYMMIDINLIIFNQCIREKTGAQNIVKEIKHYQIKWLQHVQRMDTNRLP